MMEAYRNWYRDHEDEILEGLFSFLRFPSVSTDPKRRNDVAECAEFISQKLYQMGYSSEVWETDGHPLVFGYDLSAGPAAPTLLLYLHYDVQPEDPLDEWVSDPFSPEVREGNVYARGAVDNKGQAYFTLAALQAYKELGNGNLNIKVLIEGEEEIGSPSLFRVLKEKKEVLKAEHGLIVDVDIPSLDEPVVTIGTRGLVTLNAKVCASKEDLHSGMLGGVALNPLRVVSKLVSALWDDDGKVTLTGFYDGIVPIKAELQKKTALEGICDRLGIAAKHHETGYALHETGSIRPTLEINGIHGGYGGPGCKTVIPKEVEVKMSCRLVPGQNPAAIISALKAYFETNVPDGMTVAFSDEHAAESYVASGESEFATHVRQAYEAVLGTPCGNSFCGGTIPITKALAEVVKKDVLGMGYCFIDDGMHAPNEHFGLDRFAYGFLTMAHLFDRMSTNG